MIIALKWLIGGSLVRTLLLIYVSVMVISPISVLVASVGGRYLLEPVILLLAVAYGVFFPQKMLELMPAFRSLNFLGPLLLIFMGGLLGLLAHGDFVAAYAEVRCLSLLLLTVVYLFSAKVKTIDITLGILWTGILSSLVTIGAVRYGIVILDGPKYAYPFLAGGAVVVAAAYLRSVSFFAFGSALMFYMAVMATYRTYLIVSILVILYAVGIFLLYRPPGPAGAKRQFVNIGKVLVVAALICIASVVAVPRVISYFQDDESRYLHTFIKTENLIKAIKGEGSLNASDTQRLDYYVDVISNPGYYIIPKGLGSRAYMDEMSVKFATSGVVPSTLDSGIYFILFHYGLLLGAGALGFVCYKYFTFGFRSFYFPHRLMAVVGFGVMLAYLIVTTESLVQPSKTVILGFFVYLALLPATEALPLRPVFGPRKDRLRIAR